MDWDTWQKLYRRLCVTYGRSVNGEQAAVYFEALSAFSASVVEAAIAKVATDHKTWPSVAELCERARSIIASTPYQRRACDLCHGDGFIEAPDQEHFQRTYTNYVTRCPQCYPSRQAEPAA